MFAHLNELHRKLQCGPASPINACLVRLVFCSPGGMTDWGRGGGGNEKVKGSAILVENLQVRSNRPLIKNTTDVKGVRRLIGGHVTGSQEAQQFLP